jgi:hypothetical protein
MRIKAIIDSAARGLSARRSKEKERRKRKESDGILIKLQFCDEKIGRRILYHAPFCWPISFLILLPVGFCQSDSYLGKICFARKVIRNFFIIISRSILILEELQYEFLIMSEKDLSRDMCHDFLVV